MSKPVSVSIGVMRETEIVPMAMSMPIAEAAMKVVIVTSGRSLDDPPLSLRPAYPFRAQKQGHHIKRLSQFRRRTSTPPQPSMGNAHRGGLYTRYLEGVCISGTTAICV